MTRPLRPRDAVCQVYWRRPEARRCHGCPLMATCHEQPPGLMSWAWLADRGRRMDQEARAWLA